MEADANKHAEFIASFAAMQSEIKNIRKDSKNTHFKSEYVALDTLVDYVRPLLSKHGFSFHQTVSDGQLHTVLTHVNTMERVSSVPLLLDKQTMQAVGSAITYARRYCLLIAVGTAETLSDDDGNEASLPTEEDRHDHPHHHVAPRPPNRTVAADAPVGFDPSNREHAKKLRNILAAQKIPSSMWDTIAQRMKGRPSSDIDTVINEAI